MAHFITDRFDGADPHARVRRKGEPMKTNSKTAELDLDDLVTAVLHKLAYRHPHWPQSVRDEIKKEITGELYLVEEITQFWELVEVLADAGAAVEMRGERDRARATAVRLEQENAHKDEVHKGEVQSMRVELAKLRGLLEHAPTPQALETARREREDWHLAAQLREDAIARALASVALMLRGGDPLPVADVAVQIRNDLTIEGAEQKACKPEHVEGIEPCADHSPRTVYYCCTPPASGQPADGGTEK